MEKGLLELINDYRYSLAFSLSDELDIAGKTGCSLQEVEDAALSQGVVPLRYQRNLGAISLQDQQRLLHAKVSVVGCGGLGGFIIEELARLGIGEISAWDYDYFQEHNLNRQLMSATRLIGSSKIEAAARQVRRINPGITFNGIYRRFTGDEIDILEQQQVVIDALDNVPARLELSDSCRKLGIPLVHGAVSNWYGQVTSQFPGETTLEKIYKGKKNYRPDDRSVLVFTAAVTASLQVAEVIKILLDKGSILRQKLLLIDMLAMTIDIIEIGG
jgi:molybdopterin/thiamine biosynthesis adenylyltransferase